MTPIATAELKMEPDVADFLKRRNAEEQFQIVCQLARECYPEATTIEVSLLADPDVEDRWWVVIEPVLPAGHPSELFQEQDRRYYHELPERLPPARFPDPFCTVDPRIAQE
jgi:hypothetical protein